MSREKGSRKLTNAPLVFVLAQVRYSPILSMEKFVPTIQEQVRKVFPKYRKGIIQSLTIGSNDQAPQLSNVNRWEFANKDSNTGFILQADSFVYHTTNYHRFADFIEGLQFALSKVNEAVEFALVERIGLRYIDVVEPKDKESLRDYLYPGLAGFPLHDLGVSMLVSHSEAVAKTAHGTLVLKATQKLDNRVLPPDLFPIGLEVKKSVSSDRSTAIFDFDHFSEQSIEFSLEEVVRRLSNLHDTTSDAFWMTITDHAIRQWT